MILKLENGYLELNELIEVEKKVKLFEDVSTTVGDFSYSFNIPKTHHNVKLIGIYSVQDSAKRWARKIPADILNDSGILLHRGFLRIESDLPNRDYTASFFSGNSNWMDELNFNLLEINWESLTVPGIDASWANTTGIVFPLTDRGTLMNRKSPPLLSEDDFNGYIYVTDLVTRVLAYAGMKMEGDLLQIPEYNKLITTSGNQKYLQNEIAKREAYIGKSSNQSIPSSPSSAPVYYPVTFTDVSSPYFNSEVGNWDVSTSRYFFDTDVKDLELEVNLPLGSGTSGLGLRIYKNGGSASDVIYSTIISPNTNRIRLNLDTADLGYDTPGSGDYYQVSLAVVTTRSVIAGAWIRIKPTKFFQTFATDTIPDMTASVLMGNIFKMFNILVSYNASTKTIYANNFDKILNSEPIDLSKYMTIDENNFEDFVSDYSKNNLLLWSEGSNEFISDFNDSNPDSYASGNLQIDNDFLDEESELIELDFKNSWQYLNNAFGLELPLTNLITGTVVGMRDLTSVSNSGGEAVFNYSGSAFIGIIRISESTIPDYNGDYYQYTYVASQFQGRVTYLGNATGKVELIATNFQQSDPVFLINNPNQNLQNISGLDFFLLGTPTNSVTTVAVANFLNTENFRDSLGFYALKNKYFVGTERLLNNGLKSFASGNLPEAIYNKIDFTRTVVINGIIYYINLIRGYKGSKYRVTMELIKK